MLKVIVVQFVKYDWYFIFVWFLKYSYSIFLLLFLNIVYGQSDHKLHLFKTTEKIKIDGILDEPVWKTCEPAGDFWQNFPYDTCLAKTKTVAYVTYNETSIFIAILTSPFWIFVAYFLNKRWTFPFRTKGQSVVTFLLL